jgi:hypothetical protein
VHWKKTQADLKMTTKASHAEWLRKHKNLILGMEPAAFLKRVNFYIQSKDIVNRDTLLYAILEDVGTPVDRKRPVSPAHKKARAEITQHMNTLSWWRLSGNRNSPTWFRVTA